LGKAKQGLEHLIGDADEPGSGFKSTLELDEIDQFLVDRNTGGL